MAALSRDTSVDAEQVQIQIWREMPPWRKLELVAQMNAAVRELALLGIRQRYPKATPTEIKRRYADLVLGERLAKQVYGELPKSAAT